jgi:hypothetical protein
MDAHGQLCASALDEPVGESGEVLGHAAFLGPAFHSLALTGLLGLISPIATFGAA